MTNDNSKPHRFKSLPLWVFALFFMAVPVSQLGFDPHLLLQLMPGDLGDARLNNYFLENIYQFVLGNSQSLWHLGFFWPFPYVLGFSDNLFGASPVYILARSLGGQADTAFQIWFLAGYAFNFWASYYALTKLGISRLSACVGAVIFTFAIPVTAHASHAQLHHRFAVPLALLYTVQFFERRQLWLLTAALAWLIWQFYCGVYIGFFAALLLLATSTAFLVKSKVGMRAAARDFAHDVRKSWNTHGALSKSALVFAWTAMAILLVLLFYPYLQVTKLYGVKRTWDDIATMLPRPHSYLMADTSWLWAQPGFKLFANTPIRHEHQMFPGLVSFGLLIAAIIYGVRTTDAAGRAFSCMVFALGLLVVVTLHVGGLSLWYLVHWLPLASAIRAMTRIDLVMLLPVAFAVAYFLDRLRDKGLWGTRIIVLLVLPALLIELSATFMNVSEKMAWRQRLESKAQQIPANAAKDAVLFFALTKDVNPLVQEVDAMWAAIQTGRKTMNGYSGSRPQASSYDIDYGLDCSIIPKRIASYIEFTRQHHRASLSSQELITQVLPVGFAGCDEAALLPSRAQ
jgi:hypothetical protein